LTKNIKLLTEQNELTAKYF